MARVFLLPLALAACAGCPGGGGMPDARPVDGPEVDAAPDDAGEIDANDPCPGRLLFTGDYLDWDSTESAFMGIHGAELRDRNDPSAVATTAPNGRALLCVAAGLDTEVSFTEEDYLPLVFSMDAAAAAVGPFSTKGLTMARLATLFATDLSLTHDPADALVLVEVRDFPGGAPVIGATVTLGNAHDGAFTMDSAGAWQSGATTTDDAWVLFANVGGATAVDGDGGTYGSTTVTVTPPVGTDCVGPETLSVGANELGATIFACD